MANRNIEFVRSKSCRDCTQTIFYSIKGHEWTDDPELKVRHNCTQWKSIKPNDDVIDIVDHIQRQIIDIQSDIAIIKRNLWENSQAVFDIQSKMTKK